MEMNFQFGQVALFMACLIGLIVFSVYSIRTARKSGIAGYLRGLLFAVGTTIVAMSRLITEFVGFLASSADTSEEEENIDGDYLIGVYNFRTRKFDNGTDPYGWYEEDL